MTCSDLQSIRWQNRRNICNIVVTYNEESNKVRSFCPETCKYDCTQPEQTLTSAPTISPIPVCLDNKRFGVYDEERDSFMTCQVLQNIQWRYRRNICKRELTFQDETKEIALFCPETCRYDCPQLRNADGRDIQEFSAYVQKRDIFMTCSDLQSIRWQNRRNICNIVVTYNEESNKVSSFCPETCNSDYVQQQ